MQRSRGHIGYDLAILVLIVLIAAAFLQSGLERRSLAFGLFGAWGLVLAASFVAGLALSRAFESLGGKLPEFEAGLFLPAAVAGGMIGAAWGLTSHAWGPVGPCWAAGGAAGVVLGFGAKRLPRAAERLGAGLSEAVMLTFAAYLIVPVLMFLYSAFVLPFVESGFSTGLKIAGVMGVFTALVVAFFWALNRSPAFAKAATAAVLFGLMFGFAAFLTLVLVPSETSDARGLLTALGLEALAAALVSGAYLYEQLRKAPKVPGAGAKAEALKELSGPLTERLGKRDFAALLDAGDKELIAALAELLEVLEPPKSRAAAALLEQAGGGEAAQVLERHAAAQARLALVAETAAAVELAQRRLFALESDVYGPALDEALRREALARAGKGRLGAFVDELRRGNTDVRGRAVEVFKALAREGGAAFAEAAERLKKG